MPVMSVDTGSHPGLTHCMLLIRIFIYIHVIMPHRSQGHFVSTTSFSGLLTFPILTNDAKNALLYDVTNSEQKSHGLVHTCL